jgi:hypothetical protein
MTTSTSVILKKIGNPNLALYKGTGYWYFVYDDLDANSIYENQIVYVKYLSNMSVEQWVEEGKCLVNSVA